MPQPRVSVQAGFHKSDTTFAQRFLRANGKHISPLSALAAAKTALLTQDSHDDR